MKTTLLLALVLGVAAPICAQQNIPAPSGWTMQPRAGGARVFTPSNLQTGEIYSVTVYDSVSLNEKTLEEYLRAFAGPVGKKVGNLGAPLQIQTDQGRLVNGTGVYVGPNGSKLIALYLGISIDGGANIHVMRTLISQTDLLERYQTQSRAISEQLVKRASAEAGDNIFVVPQIVRQKFVTIGGALKPGVYAGNQYHDQELRSRLRVYLYETGEYRICNEKDEDLGDYGTGQINYNRNSGQLDLKWTMGLGTRGSGDEQFCYFGLDAQGKPAIYAEDNVGYETHTLLTWVEPPLKRLSPKQQDEQSAAIEAEKNRFKWVVAPGKGVANAQIAAVLLDSKFNNGSADETVYLLLKDGSVYADLPVAPDELAVLKSKQKEPDKWGKWRKVGATYKVSWAGAPYQNLPGSPVVPSPAQAKIAGRYGTGRFSGVIGMMASSSQWGVTFDKNGRFRKDSRSLTTSSMGFGDNATHTASGSNDGESFAGGFGANFAFSTSQKAKNPNGAREGDYSLNGYVLTMRYDNGKVERLPFFFLDAARKGLWFEGSSMSLDEPDKK